MPAEPENLDAELSAYLDGELPPERGAAVRAHLERSADARRLLAELTAVSDGLRALPHAAAPAGLTAAVSDEVGARLRMRTARRRRLWWWSSGLSAAALLVLAVLMGKEGGVRRPVGGGTPVAAREMRATPGVADAPVVEMAPPPAGAAGEADVVMAARDKAERTAEPTNVPPAATLLPVAAEMKSESLVKAEEAEEPAEFSLMPVEMEQYAALVTMLREWVLAGLATQEVTPLSDPQVYVLASPAAASQVAQLVQVVAALPAKRAPARGAARTDTRGRVAGAAPGAAAASQPATLPAAQSQPASSQVRVIIHRPSPEKHKD